MATKNSTILGKFLLTGTNDVQQRLGFSGEVGTAQIKNLMSPLNMDIWNSFCSFLINRVGYSYTHQQRWENPLKEFFKQKLYYGNSVEENMLGWIKGHSYDVDAEDQFKTYYPDGLQAFHSVNHKVVYPTSISREQMRRAVVNDEGLAQLVSAIMAQPMNSDEYDIYNEMLDLFKAMDDNYTLHRTTLTAAPIDETGCKEFLQKLQQFAYDITVPSTEYSQTDIPVFAKPDELVLFVRSSVMAATNVQALAAAYNLEKVDIQYRLKVIPDRKWPLNDGDYAILTTSDFFQCYPVEYLTTSQVDPSGLKVNGFLHDWCIVSSSPFVPITVFSTDAAAELTNVTMTPGTLKVYTEKGGTGAKAGDVVQLVATLDGTVTGDDTGTVTVAPQSVLWSVACVTDGVTLNSRTYVDGNNKLHIQKTGMATGAQLTVTATSTYKNPGGATTPITGDVVITIE